MYTLVQDYELVTKSQFTKHIETWNTTTKSQSPSNKSLLEPPPFKPNPSGASLARDGKGKGVASESHKMHSRVQCFKCQGFGHNASSVNVLVMLPLTVPTRPLSLIGKSMGVKKKALKNDLSLTLMSSRS